MSLLRGDTLGPYEVIEPLGEGGMGEVYRARDTRLDRLVALKVSKTAFDERFEREARSVAALSHPHICALYDVGPNYLVMELVEGVPLAGPLPVDQAVEYAGQILDALDAAHKKGITHRDLKPANILVTKHGIKLLDFGLAKQTTGPLGDAQATMSALTSQGQILGTLQYMAPEQLQGQPTDARADLFAFGCVLYELLSGTRAFDGSSPASVIAAILERQPAPLTTHPPLDRVIATCLAKQPDDRFQTALDTKRAMQWAMEQPAASATTAIAPVSRSRERVLMVLAATALVALAAVSYRWYPRPTPPPEPIAFTVAPPPDQQFIGASYLSVSPDGRHIAYVTGNGAELWVRSVGSTASRRLDRADLPWSPTWSPDSRTIAFTSRGGTFTKGLRTVDVTTGQVRTLAPDASGSRPAWSQHGVILFQGGPGNSGKLYQVQEAGGTPVVAMEADASRQETSITRPEFLPDGRRYIFLAYSADSAKSGLFLASLDAPGRTFLLNVVSNVEYAGGYLFYHRDGTLMAHPFNPDAGRLTGEPAPIVENVQYNANGMGAFSVSESGVLAFVTGNLSTETTRLLLTNRAGASPRQIGEPGRYLTANLSPDGRQAVIERYRSQGNINSRELALLDIDRGVTTRFTAGQDEEWDSVWSPDGSQVVFASTESRPNGIYRRSAGGAAVTAELIYSSSERAVPVDWSRDGKLLMIRGQGSSARLWVMPMTGDRTPVEAFPGAPNPHDQSSFSPDGTWIAYSEREGLESEVYVQPYPADGRRVRISTATGINPRWTPDGRQIVYRAMDGTFYAVDLRPDGQTFRPAAPVRLFSQPPRSIQGDRRYGADARLDRFLLTTPIPGVLATPITVMVNFVQGLSKAVR
jgi:eukaryotic-like serine/threonine-protein kinase